MLLVKIVVKSKKCAMCGQCLLSASDWIWRNVWYLGRGRSGWDEITGFFPPFAIAHKQPRYPVCLPVPELRQVDKWISKLLFGEMCGT